ncbi:hypothetical protein BGZ63DRAFT_388444 [Mariannaea sp. PMI_226]|nr:hypothetical protein BGZ63DRAFT_388444 [Mariannaea sp. PMI_226]
MSMDFFTLFFFFHLCAWFFWFSSWDDVFLTELTYEQTRGNGTFLSFFPSCVCHSVVGRFVSVFPSSFCSYSVYS